MSKIVVNIVNNSEISGPLRISGHL
jgi:hypothetical protein